MFSLWTFYFENGTQLNCFEDDSVLYSNGNGCFFTGIEKIFSESNLKVYPNPATEKLFIELDKIGNSFQATISLFSIAGKEVYSTNINSSYNTIDVSSFRSGLYLLKITSDDGESKTTLVSIQ